MFHGAVSVTSKRTTNSVDLYLNGIMLLKIYMLPHLTFAPQLPVETTSNANLGEIFKSGYRGECEAVAEGRSEQKSPYTIDRDRAMCCTVDALLGLLQGSTCLGWANCPLIHPLNLSSSLYTNVHARFDIETVEAVVRQIYQR